jgi:hypothetical protein
MRITVMSGLDPAGVVRSLSWDGFVSFIKSQSKTVPKTANKKESPSFSCVEFKGGYRSKENVIGRMGAISLDFDKVDEGLLKKFDGIKYVAWTTWSSCAGAERWRVVVPVHGGFDPSELGRYVDSIEKKIGVRVDRCSRDVAHLWFLPYHRDRRHHRVVVGDGVEYRIPVRLDFSDVPGVTHTTVDGEGRSTQLFSVALKMAPECVDSHALIEAMEEWSLSNLSPPMKRSELRRQVMNAWKASLNNSQALRRRARAVKNEHNGEFCYVEGWTPRAKDPIRVLRPLVGNFLYPGATILSAKLKEGKSYLCAQLACSIATGVPFLAGGVNGHSWRGFSVAKPVDVIMVAGEDDEALIDNRFKKRWRAGQLPNAEGHIQIYLADHLKKIREANPGVDGIDLLEQMMEKWYSLGYRVFFFDPLVVIEFGFGITKYPGGVEGRQNVHSKDMLVAFYYQRLAQRFPGTAIIVSMHHGKNKLGHDASDPADMIAATSGYGAGVMGTIAILPCSKVGKDDEDDDEEHGKRRELFFLGRHTPMQRLLIEQDTGTGLWKCLGQVEDAGGTRTPVQSLLPYLRVLDKLGGKDRVVSRLEIAREVGKSPATVAVRMGLIGRGAMVYDGCELSSRPGVNGGYRLVKIDKKK